MEPIHILILFGFLIVSMLPAGILVIGALYTNKSMPGSPGLFVMAGALLLLMCSMQTGLQYYVSVTTNMETLATYMIKSSIIFGGLNYLGLILLGIGLILLAGEIRNQKKVKHP